MSFTVERHYPLFAGCGVWRTLRRFYVEEDAYQYLYVTIGLDTGRYRIVRHETVSQCSRSISPATDRTPEASVKSTAAGGGRR